MARRRSKILSQREFEVMEVVWKLGEASVRDVRNELGGERAGAYTSIATMLKFLEKKGALRHKKNGRTFVYIPVYSKENEQRNAVHYILNTFFDGKAHSMVDTIIQVNNISKEELQSIHTMIGSSLFAEDLHFSR